MSAGGIIIKRKRLFYSPEDDLHILREVAGQNPFEDPNRWPQIRKNIMDLCGKDFSERSLKERVNLLAQRFSIRAQNDVYKSGIEEEVSEIDDLLYTLLQLINEYKSKPKKSTESSHQKGLKSREQALTNYLINESRDESSVQIQNVALLPAYENTTIEDIYSNPSIEVNYDVVNDVNNNNSSTNNEDIENVMNANKRTPAKDVGGTRKGGGKGKVGGAILTPTRTRSSGGLKQSSIRFLEKKNERWFEIRSKELALEDKKLEIEAAEKMKRLEMDERRLQMEEKRLAIEEKRLEMAEKRFKAEFDIFKNQQRLMEVAFLNCNCKKN